MAFARNENHITLLSHHTGCTDGLTTVYDADDLLHLTGIEACQHVVDDILRLFETRIIGSNDHTVALLHGLLGHQRTLALVTVTTSTTDGDHLTFAIEYLVDGIQHILQRIRGMGIVDDSGIAFWRMDGLQTTVHALQRAQDDEDILRLLAQHDSCAVDGQQIAHIKLTDELYANLPAVDVEIHALEVALDDLGLEIGHRPRGIGLHLSLRVLYHHSTVLIVGIDDGKGILPQSVEEGFLRVAVVLEGLMIVQMVTRQIGEQSTCEMEATDTLLGDGVARTLHKSILTAGIHHLCQEPVQFDGIGGGMVCRNRLILDIVADGREQTALMAELPEHII